MLAALGAALKMDGRILTQPLPGTETDSYVMLSSSSDRGLLVSGDSRRAAAAGAFKFSNSRSLARKARNVAAWIVLRANLVSAMPRFNRRVHIVRDDEPSLFDHLREVAGDPNMRFAISIGPPRPNQKPVIQLISDTGRTRGFAKIGWNELTSRLVDHEARYLKTMGREMHLFAAPEVVHDGTWNGLRISISTGPASKVRWMARSRIPSGPVIQEIACAQGRASRMEYGGSPSYERLVERAGQLASPQRLIASQAIERVLEQFAGVTANFGDWHGDFTPWNLVRRSPVGYFVWDWERAGGPQVVGMDLFYYHFEEAHFGGHSAEDSIRHAAHSSRSAIELCQGDGFPIGLIAEICMLELFLRYWEPDTPYEYPLEQTIGKLLIEPVDLEIS